MFVYIHVPFCSNICAYCDFPKVLYDKKYIDRYLERLDEEIDARYKGEKVKSIFIGGGTPTSLSYQELERLLKLKDKLCLDSDIEFTIESNVECLNEEKIKLLKRYGVNRVSLGVQSFNDKVLKDLNRHHTGADVFRVVDCLKKNGIFSISIDLIYGVNDDIDIVRDDINNFLKLDIPHVSCYSLIIENNTLYGINNREYIDDDIEYKMYTFISNTLEEHGYKHYEVSNYAKEGYYSLHNINYWDNGEYYGFGMGAVSYVNSNRISNTRNLSKYLKGDMIDSIIYEDKETSMSNSIILGLRKVKGIDVLEFNLRYGVDIINLYNIRELIDEGKLVYKNGYLYIATDYYYVANDILVNFV